MSIKDELYELIGYLDCTRRVGHTTTVMEGAVNNDCIVLAHNQHYADTLSKQYNVDARTYRSKSLRGRRTPIVFDNEAIRQILADSLNFIKKQEEEIGKLNNKIEAIRSIIK